MTKEEFNLSEKIWIDDQVTEKGVIATRDVKEFIKRLKKKFKRLPDVYLKGDIENEIDKLCGDKLK